MNTEHSSQFALNTLRSANAILVVLSLALIAQTPHAADVFRIIGHSDGWWAHIHSYSFAVALELAVLLFVVQNRHIESYGFAAVSIAMNLSYYYLTGNALFSVAAFPDWLVSIALPVAIARYSHAVADAAPMDADEQFPRRVTKTTLHVERTDEHPVALIQPAQIEHQTVVGLTTLTDEQKREHVLELVRSGEQLNKSELAKALGIGRTTLYNWISEAK